MASSFNPSIISPTVAKNIYFTKAEIMDLFYSPAGSMYYVKTIEDRNLLTGLNVLDLVIVEDSGSGLTQAFEVESTIDGTGANSVFIQYNTKGGQYLGTGKTKGIEYFSQTSEPNENIVIPSGLNAFSIDNFTIADGATLTIEDGAVYKVL